MIEQSERPIRRADFVHRIVGKNIYVLGYINNHYADYVSATVARLQQIRAEHN